MEKQKCTRKHSALDGIFLKLYGKTRADYEHACPICAGHQLINSGNEKRVRTFAKKIAFCMDAHATYNAQKGGGGKGATKHVNGHMLIGPNGPKSPKKRKAQDDPVTYKYEKVEEEEPFPLMELPPDIIVEIAKHIEDPATIINYFTQNKAMYQIFKNTMHWNRIRYILFDRILEGLFPLLLDDLPLFRYLDEDVTPKVVTLIRDKPKFRRMFIDNYPDIDEDPEAYVEKHPEIMDRFLTEYVLGLRRRSGRPFLGLMRLLDVKNPRATREIEIKDPNVPKNVMSADEKFYDHVIQRFTRATDIYSTALQEKETEEGKKIVVLDYANHSGEDQFIGMFALFATVRDMSLFDQYFDMLDMQKNRPDEFAQKFGDFQFDIGLGFGPEIHLIQIAIESGNDLLAQRMLDYNNEHLGQKDIVGRYIFSALRLYHYEPQKAFPFLIRAKVKLEKNDFEIDDDDYIPLESIYVVIALEFLETGDTRIYEYMLELGLPHYAHLDLVNEEKEAVYTYLNKKKKMTRHCHVSNWDDFFIVVKKRLVSSPRLIQLDDKNPMVMAMSKYGRRFILLAGAFEAILFKKQ